MSTFSGIIQEVPKIQVDNFVVPWGTPPPVANFLSHVHSDHLKGLAGPNYRAPTLYCSEATKNILLRLERRFFWYNAAKDHLESSQVAYIQDRNIRNSLVKTLPLDIPTLLEIAPGRTIRVTLFDANHCPGATMFLFEEGDKAVLYTGDIRAESWWINSLKRHPVLLPFMSGIKTLDKIYLDTSNGRPNRAGLSSKGEGISELIRMLDRYPPDTIFHLNTWTFGYEEVWVALATHYRTQVHLNKYKYRLYQDVKTQATYQFGPFLKGFEVGNAKQDGVLTTNWKTRLHSCDLSLGCPELDENKDKVVYISPVIRKYRDGKGNLVIEKEAGEGSRRGDLDMSTAWELDMALLLKNASPEDLDVLRMLQELGEKEEAPMPLEIDIDEDQISLKSLFASLRAHLAKREVNTQVEVKDDVEVELPKWIGFPYARHSSFEELREFVGAFRPRDVYPCVVDENAPQDVANIKNLFGDLLSGTKFQYDEELKVKMAVEQAENYDADQAVADYNEETQRSELSCSDYGAVPESYKQSHPPEVSKAKVQLATTEEPTTPIRSQAVLACSHPNQTIEPQPELSGEAVQVDLQAPEGIKIITEESPSSSSPSRREPTQGSRKQDGDDADMEDSQAGSQGVTDFDAFMEAQHAARDKDGSSWFAKSATLTFNTTWSSSDQLSQEL